MFSTLKDLPDGAIGIAAAACLHFTMCYTVLAPRAMEVQFEEEVTPSCMAMLQGEEDRAIADARQDDAKARDKARRELNQLEQKLNAYDQLKGLSRDSGLEELMKLFGVPDYGPSQTDIAALRRAADDMRTALRSQPDFSHLRASASQVMQTCSCAALQAAAGKRTSYAISLASFRLIEPEEISNVSDTALRFAKGSACAGQLPWRKG